MLLIVWLIARRSPARVNRVLPPRQLVSGGFVAFTHGTNDAQKTMGIIALALVASGNLDDGLRASADLGDRHPPRSRWRPGRTPAAGGSSRRSGTRDRQDRPAQGFAAQTACAAMLWTTAHYGFPVSTTHTISGSVMGAGAIRGLSAVRWGVAGNIVVAWIFTIPRRRSSAPAWNSSRGSRRRSARVRCSRSLIAADAFMARRWETRRLAPATA